MAFTEEEVRLVSFPFLKSNDVLIVDLLGDCWMDASEIDHQEMYVVSKIYEELQKIPQEFKSEDIIHIDEDGFRGGDGE